MAILWNSQPKLLANFERVHEMFILLAYHLVFCPLIWQIRGQLFIWPLTLMLKKLRNGSRVKDSMKGLFRHLL